MDTFGNRWTRADSPYPLSCHVWWQQNHQRGRKTGACGGDIESYICCSVPNLKADNVSEWCWFSLYLGTKHSSFWRSSSEWLGILSKHTNHFSNFWSFIVRLSTEIDFILPWFGLAPETQQQIPQLHDDESAICDETERFSGFIMRQFYFKLELQSDMEG